MTQDDNPQVTDVEDNIKKELSKKDLFIKENIQLIVPNIVDISYGPW